MQKLTLMSTLCSLFFLNSQALGQDEFKTCTAAAASDFNLNALVRDLRTAPHSEALWDALNRHSPQFWNEMGSRARAETVETLWTSLNDFDESGDDFDESAVEWSLRFARINESIRNQEDVCSAVGILSPQLERDLGYGRGTSPEILSSVAQQIIAQGDEPSGTFSTLKQFRSAYQLTVEENWSGK
jgi:hypothetical protein